MNCVYNNNVLLLRFNPALDLFSNENNEILIFESSEESEESE